MLFRKCTARCFAKCQCCNRRAREDSALSAEETRSTKDRTCILVITRGGVHFIVHSDMPKAVISIVSSPRMTTSNNLSLAAEHTRLHGKGLGRVSDQRCTAVLI